MEKRYQVFISSTFADLEEERKEVMEAILNLDCFPAGMEMFPAADIEQFEYIKTVIDQSDYYILIIAGRYGSLAEDGSSYTEKEYEYAREMGIPVLVFIKKDIENIPLNKTDNDQELRKKLIEFRNKVMESRLAKFWDEKLQLKYMVHESLSKTIRMNPRDGWVRGNNITKAETFMELEKLRIENDDLKNSIEELMRKDSENENIEELARGDDLINIEFEYAVNSPYSQQPYNPKLRSNMDISWNKIFLICAEIISDGYVLYNNLKESFESSFSKYVKEDCYSLYISDNTFNIIKYQLEALGLLEIDNSNDCEIFNLTDKGKKEFRSSFLIKRK